MAKTVKIDVQDGDLVSALRQFFGNILELEDVSAIAVPQSLPMKNMVMPTLVTDPEQLKGVDPLAPAFPMNSAKVVSKLTRKPFGGKIVAVMRSCEIRAFIELVKLKQGQLDELVVLGIDCLGAFTNTDYFRFVGDSTAESTRQFYQHMLSGNDTELDGADLSTACKACEFPIPDNADISIGLYGIDTNDHLIAAAQSSKGEALVDQLKLPETEAPAGRSNAIEALIEKRTAFRDQMFEETREQVNNLEKLTTFLANCVNCYNCRVACPVCYCKECVFVTDVFNHDPSQYLQWASRKGVIKLPTDTVFYHTTRLAHMSTACIGCGQCSNACPNDVSVMELFRTLSYRTQKAFDYEPGKSIDDEPPLSVFREDELTDIVGVGKG